MKKCRKKQPERAKELRKEIDWIPPLEADAPRSIFTWGDVIGRKDVLFGSCRETAKGMKGTKRDGKALIV